METNYIPHSQIIVIGTAVDTSSSNACDKLFIQTKDGNYTTKQFTTDSNGINGVFTKI